MSSFKPAHLADSLARSARGRAPLVWTRPYSDPDVLAKRIAEWAALARAMPPAWEGASISHAIGGDGGAIGRMLPGKGLLLKEDLKNLGINTPLPAVYERSPFLRLTDKWHRRKWSDRARSVLIANHLGYSTDILDRILSERGAITTYDGIIAARAAQTGAPLDITVMKPSITSVANQWHSMQMQVGTPAAQVNTGNPGAAMTATNAGAWNLPWTTPGSNNRYLLSFGYAAGQIINFAMLVDILVAVSALALGSSATTTFNSAALTRYTSGAGVLPIFEVSTLFGGTAATMVLNYTGVGTGTNTTAALPVRSTAAIVTMLQPSPFSNAANTTPWISLGTGDYGLTQATSIVMAGSAMTTGAAHLYLYYPLLFVPGLAANMYIERDSTTQIDGLIALAKDGSNVNGCLGLFVQTNTTSSGIITAFMRSCVG
jgi:hypothetical protein